MTGTNNTPGTQNGDGMEARTPGTVSLYQDWADLGEAWKTKLASLERENKALKKRQRDEDTDLANFTQAMAAYNAAREQMEESMNDYNTASARMQTALTTFSNRVSRRAERRRGRDQTAAGQRENR